MNDAYSPYKASRHPWITSAIQEADPSIVPAHVQLILSDLCNHSCDFCFPAGTQIRLADGSNRSIVRIALGDAVLDAFGEPRRVVGLFAREYAGELVQVSIFPCKTLTGTPDHVVHVMDLGGSRIQLPLKLIKKGHTLVSLDSPSLAAVVVAVDRVPHNDPVYNIEVEGSHTYVANSIAVNNCAYRTPGYSSSQLFYTTNPALAGNLARDRKHPEHNYNPKRWIPTERALALVEEMAALGVRAIQLTGGGEPTVNPAFAVVCQRIRELGMEYAVVSNGSLVGARDLYKDFAGASWVRISVDAGIARTYATTRGTKAASFNAVWDTIKAIKTHGCPVVGIGFVVTPQNWQEIAVAAEMARDAGADNIRISAMFSPEGAALFRPFYEAAQRQCRAAKALETDRFRVFDRFGARVEDLELQAPEYRHCRYQHYTTYIGADLNVYRCCVYSYNKRGLIGSVANQSFRDLWVSQKRMNDMLTFDATSCERCQFNNLNRFLNYLTASEDPPHANFV